MYNIKKALLFNYRNKVDIIMEDNVLITNEKYEGLYVALIPFIKDIVISYGSTSIQVLKEAQKRE